MVDISSVLFACIRLSVVAQFRGHSLIWMFCDCSESVCVFISDFDLFGTDLNRNKIVLFWFSLNFQDCFGLGCSV